MKAQKIDEYLCTDIYENTRTYTIAWNVSGDYITFCWDRLFDPDEYMSAKNIDLKMTEETYAIL